MKLRDRLLTSGALLYGLGMSSIAEAQVIPDGTTPTSVGTCSAQCLVTGGTFRGSNLFHSFQELNVGSNQRVQFANPDGISNILSRVTGANVSNIQGILQVDGGANLFLLNPNGIIFGPNAQLDIRGSFLATTADSFVFPDGSEFSAVTSQAPPLLAIHTPTGLQMGAAPGVIINQSRVGLESSSGFPVSGGLQLSSGRTLALIGGRVIFSGGLATVPEGRVELGSVAGGNLVNLGEAGANLTFDYTDVREFLDIQLSAPDLDIALISTSGDRAGSIHLQGRRMTFRGVLLDSTTSESQGGDLTIRASGSVRLSGDNTILLTNTLRQGTGGNINISSQQLIVEQGASINSFTEDRGRAGNVLITVLDEVELLGTSSNGFFSGIGSQSLGGGSSGNVTIEARRLLIRDGAILDTSTFGVGNAGNITIRATESVTVSGDAGEISTSSISAQATGGGGTNSGDAANITITTQQLLVENGAQISVAGRGGGNAGSLTIDASDSVQLRGFSPTLGLQENTRSGLFVSAEAGANSLAGDLNINAQQLVIEDEARISADNLGSGLRAGNINVDVQQLVLDRGDINASTFAGEGANIILQVSDLLSLSNQSRISAEALNDANGGNIIITSDQIVAAPLGDSDIVASAIRGNGGVILITAQEISGIEEQRAIEGNGTNDIDASSEFGTSGSVVINRTDLGGVELPVTPVTAQLSQTCGGGNVASTSRFISSGRACLSLPMSR
jgi:filamentous hemagglutinin family protein